MKRSRVLYAALLVLLLAATPLLAATRLTRYHCDASFNSPVGAQFQAWWPCLADWSSWGTTSNYKDVIENWDDCQEGEQTRTCWVYECDQWVQVTCP